MPRSPPLPVSSCAKSCVVVCLPLVHRSRSYIPFLSLRCIRISTTINSMLSCMHDSYTVKSYIITLKIKTMPSLIPRPYPSARKRVWSTFSDFWSLLTQQSWILACQSHDMLHPCKPQTLLKAHETLFHARGYKTKLCQTQCPPVNHMTGHNYSNLYRKLSTYWQLT